MHTIMIKTEKNVRTFQMLRKVKRSRAESQISHSFAGGNDRRCNLTYMKPCHQAMMMWVCGNPSMRCESRIRPGMTCMARTVNGDARSDVVRLHSHRSFVPHPYSGPLLPSDSEPCWKNCQAGKPCKGHNPGLV